MGANAMPFTGSVEDRLAIRELFGEYSDAGAVSDGEAWLDCWTDDCHWVSHLFDVTGKPALRAQWDSMWADWKSVAFFNEIGKIAVAGTLATVRSTTREIVELKSGALFKLVGRYDDRLVKVGGEWRYQLRNYTVMFTETT
jgi:ketosteroid isomerase-like protein